MIQKMNILFLTFTLFSCMYSMGSEAAKFPPHLRFNFSKNSVMVKAHSAAKLASPKGKDECKELPSPSSQCKSPKAVECNNAGATEQQEQFLRLLQLHCSPYITT